MSRVRRRLAASVLAVALGALGVVATTAPASAVPSVNGYVLTSAGSLVPLSLQPGSVGFPPVPVTGVTAGQHLVGIDYRPATGTLVGVAIDPTTGTGGVYDISTTTTPAAATLVGSGFTLPAVPAAGTSWGVDFNPTVDRIRLVGSNGSNLRLVPSGAPGPAVPGAISNTDGTLAYAPAAAGAPAIGSAAYTNSFGTGSASPTGAKATTLYSLDAATDRLVAIDNPNLGEVRSIGSLGVDVGAESELDITTSGVTYALVPTADGDQLRTVSLATGAASPPLVTISLGAGVTSSGLAIETGPSPVTAGDDGYVVTTAGDLVTFELATPGTTITVGTVTGLPTGFTVEGLDTRPVGGALYALGVNAGTGMGQLATINRSNAIATPIGGPFAIAGAGATTEYGFDFNPLVDRIRLVTSTGANLRLDPASGAVNLPADGNVAYNAGDPGFGSAPALTSTAYANSFAGAGATLHLGVDDARDVLVVFTNSNLGNIRTGAPLAVAGDTGLDVATDGRVLLLNGAALSTINPITGATTAIGTLATGSPRAFATSADYVPRPVVTITADAQTRPFGAANPTFTFTAAGFTGADTAASIDVPPTCVTPATPASPVGGYPITCSGASDPDYTFAYVAGTLTVTPAGTTLVVNAPIRVGAQIVIDLRSVSGRLTTGPGTPVIGKTVAFSVGGTPICSAATDSTGVARCPMSLTKLVKVLLAGGYQGRFAGGGNLAASTDSTPLIG